jgi:hypothetical protein
MINSTTILSNEQKFEILKLEMQLIQGRFDKYDDLIHRNRNFLVVGMTALYSYGVSQVHPELFLLGPTIAFASWCLEVLWRMEFWYQYVLRYRKIRDTLNSGGDLSELSVYDLSNHYGSRPSMARRVMACASNLEPLLFFFFWASLGCTLYVLR